MSRGGFKRLLVWQKAQNLAAVRLYTTTRLPAFAREFGLVDQMRRAAVSIASNIAEGDERDTDKDVVRFFHIAKGSTAELRSQLDLAMKIGLLAEKEFTELDSLCDEVAKMLRGLIKARSPHA
jgi:four helix bundle protein